MRVAVLVLGALTAAVPAAAEFRNPSAVRATQEELSRLLLETQSLPYAGKLDRVSAHFLGRDYKLEALGEGEGGKYDRDPLYRVDAFDCTTYVETVMALAMSADFPAFESNLLRIRYLHAEASFTTRNHFPEIDWTPNNSAQGFLRDVTSDVAGVDGAHSVTKIFDKRGWYLKMPLERVNVPGLDPTARDRLLVELRSEGARFDTREATVPYVHLDSFFPTDPQTGERRPNAELFARVASGTVMNVVRPDWNVDDELGTPLVVSHQGLILRLAGRLVVRHASSGDARQVVEADLTDFLRRHLAHPTVRGVQLLLLTP